MLSKLKNFWRPSSLSQADMNAIRYLEAITIERQKQQMSANEAKCSSRKAREFKFEGDEDEDENVDAGYAWIILAALFVINASTFGTARAYGLIFENLARQDDATSSRTMAALPFTIMGAVENMGGPLTSYLISLSSWRVTVFMGSCLITLAHILAAFCDSTLCLVLTMGLMTGFGCSLVSISSFEINNAYFKRYRSSAFGIALTGAAVGTFYMSPLCQYVLSNYSYKPTKICYLLLGFILFPNVLLSLLLKPRKNIQTISKQEKNINSISQNLSPSKEEKQLKLQQVIKLVITTPIFHFIWPTQVLFCWLNFVFGMIIVDFSKDRGLSNEDGSRLVLFWALGQLTGRLVLGFLVDLRFVSSRTFTEICFAFISLSLYFLNNIDNSSNYRDILIPANVFILSMFISNLYILINSLNVEYMQKSLTSFSIGISSFTGSFFLLPRANVIGYFRDTNGNYDSMLTLFTYISLFASISWLVLPWLCMRFQQVISANDIRNIITNSIKNNRRLTSCRSVQDKEAAWQRSTYSHMSISL